MLFDNVNNNTKQGDIGEARAIYEYTKMGYTVSRTLFDSAKYDIIIDDGNKLKKVQIKTTKQKTKYGIWRVDIKTCGGNKSSNTIRNRQDSDYDILFVLTDDGRCWSIPSDKIGRCSVNVGGELYREFEIL